MAEFKHVFEHFTTPAKVGDDKKKQDEGKDGDSDEEADAFAKTE